MTLTLTPLLGLCVTVALVLAAEASRAWAFDATAASAFLKRHCADCHAGEDVKGGFRLDQLPQAIDSHEATTAWGRVVARIDSAEMPPAGNAAPPVEDARQLSQWAKEQMAAATAAARATTGRTRSRRLNRVEYENTVCDLLGINIDLKSLLPKDDKREGFDTVEAGLSISPVHIQRYMVAAQSAIDAASVRRPRPTTIQRRFVFTPERDIHDSVSNQPHIRVENDVLQFFGETHPGVPAVLRQFAQVTRTTPGKYRVKVSVSALGDELPRIPFAIRTTQAAPNLIGHYDALPGQPQVIEFVHQFTWDETFGIYPYRLTYKREDLGYGRWDKSPKACTGPALCVQWIDVEGPLVEEWPPQAHRKLYGDLPFKRTREIPPDVYYPRRWTVFGWNNFAD